MYDIHIHRYMFIIKLKKLLALLSNNLRYCNGKLVLSDLQIYLETEMT